MFVNIFPSEIKCTILTNNDIIQKGDIMQRYFVSSNEFISLELREDYHHIKNVMRSKIGDQITIVDNSNGNILLVVIDSIKDDYVKVSILDEIDSKSEFPFSITLAQGYPKGDKLELIIQKSTELGVTSIIPTMTKTSIVKLDDNKAKKKVERFKAIAKGAAEQSKRSIIPTIEDVIGLKNIDLSQYNKLFVAYEEDSKNGENSSFKGFVESISMNDNILVIVGPEGGITIDEVNYLKDNGAILGGIGPRILRTETASLYILSAISYRWDLS